MGPRNRIAIIVAALSVAGGAGMAVGAAAGVAQADVCANVGRRISVGGCVNVGDAIARYAPPPAYYAPLPEDYPPPP